MDADEPDCSVGAVPSGTDEFGSVRVRVKRIAPEPPAARGDNDEFGGIQTRVKRTAPEPPHPCATELDCDDAEEFAGIQTRVKRPAIAQHVPSLVVATPAVPRTHPTAPGVSPVSDYMDEQRRDTAPRPSLGMSNAIESAARVVGIQLAGCARGQGLGVSGRNSVESLSGLTLITGPAEDERILFEAGPRSSASSPGMVCVYPACCLGASCVAHTHHWAGLAPGVVGPVMMAALTPNELDRLEAGKPAPTDNFAGRVCLLDMWVLLLSIYKFTSISSVLCAAPSVVIPRCPRMGDPDRSAPTEDVYNPLTTVRPVPGSASPFAQPFPLLRLDQVRFYRDEFSGKWRVSLDAYKLFGKPPSDFRTGAAHRSL